MDNKESGFLSLTVKKNRDWIKFDLGNGEEIKILVKHHKSENNNLNRIIIKCPRRINIDREENDNMGNHR